MDGKRRSGSPYWEEELEYRRDWEAALVSNGQARVDLGHDRLVQGVVLVHLDVQIVPLGVLVFHGLSHGHDGPEDPDPFRGHDHGHHDRGVDPVPLDVQIVLLDGLVFHDPVHDP